MNELRSATAKVLTHPVWDIIGLITALVVILKALHPDVKYL